MTDYTDAEPLTIDVAAAMDGAPTAWDQAADSWARSTQSVATAIEALGIQNDAAARSAFETYAGLVRQDPAGTPPTGQTKPTSGA